MKLRVRRKTGKQQRAASSRDEASKIGEFYVILVCSLQDMPRVATDHGATHVVSLVQQPDLPETPSGLSADRHLKIAVDDITEPCGGKILPCADHISEFIAFVAGWRQEDGPIVLHCHAGVSRSMAAALILLSLRRPGHEREAARWLRRYAAHANPNRLIVSLADRRLNREGRLLEAIEAMGPARPVFDLAPVTRIPLVTGI